LSGSEEWDSPRAIERRAPVQTNSMNASTAGRLVLADNDMVSIILLIAIAIAAAMAAAATPRAMTWSLVGMGGALLLHAAISIAVMWANAWTVPTYINFYLLFATVPAGIILVVLGLGALWISPCVR